MAIAITITGDLRLDQTAGVQSGGTPDKDDITLATNLDALPDPFETFLVSLTGGLQTSNAATYGGAHEDSGAGFMVTATGGGITDLFFSRSNGTLFDGQIATYTDGSGTHNLTVAGSSDPIYLYSFLGGDILIGSTEAPAGVDIADPATLDGSKVAFAYYLDENATHTGADVWGVAFQPLEHFVDGATAAAHDDTVDLGDFLHVSATGSVSFDFDNLRSGNFLWVALGSEGAGLLMTGRDLNVQAGGKKDGEIVNGTNDPSDSVNTSQGGTGATTGINNQMYTPGSVGVLTFVTGFAPLPTATPGEASGINVKQIDYGGYINVTTAGVFLSQTQGGGTASMTIGAYEAGGGTAPEEGFGYIGAEGGNNNNSGAFLDDTKVGLHTVQVFNGATLVGTWVDGAASDGTTQNGVKVTITDNEASVEGLAAGMEVFLTADSGETFNRLQVSANTGTTPFDIGRVDLTETVGDTKNLGDNVFVHDDGPAIDLTPTTATIAVDESVGTGGSSKDEPGNAQPNDETTAGAPANAIGYAVTAAATLFSETADAGSDGQASKAYALVLNAGATGLTDTVTGQAVVLSLVGGVVQGRAGAGGALVFTIAVNSTTGAVTTTQFRALDHGADTNDHDSAVSMASGLVELQATLTDKDTDTGSDKIELGSRIEFEDDGPAIDLTPTTATIAVDESVGTGGSSKDEPGNAAPNDETTAGAPANAIGYAVTPAATLFSETADAGSDGQASKAYALVLNAGATGLTDTATGQAVVLSLVGGVVQGRAGAGGALVFTIAVDSATGAVTTTQFRALDHGADTNDHDSAVSMASGLVELQATLTDKDTDTASDKRELGSRVEFEDDGPAIDLTPTTATIAVDESVGTGGSSKDEPGNAAPNDETAAGAPANAIGYAVTPAATLFSETADAGSDGQASKAYALVLNAGATGLTDTATGQAVVLSLVGGVVQGRAGAGGALVFTIAVDSATGAVTTTQVRALDHGADTNDHDSAVSMASGLVELQATLTDKDTDTGSDKIELGSRVEFEDDGPAIDLTPTTATIAVDESVGTGGSSKDEPGNAAPNDETAAGAPANAIGYAVTPAATLFSETADAGSDGQASKAYALVLNAGATGLTDTATGQAVVLSLVGGVVQGRAGAGGALVFTIAVDSATGAVTTTQVRALDHGADTNDHDSAVSMASGLVELQATLTDKDTDTGSDKIELGSRIEFEDDGPAIDVDEETNGTYSAGAQGGWDHDPGEDTFESLSLTLNSYAIGGGSAVTVDTSLGTKTTTDANGNYVFAGSITDDFNGDGTDEKVDFTLTFDPDEPETFDFQVTTPPTTVTTFDTSQGSLAAGGPDAVQTLLFGGSAADNDDIVFFGVVATAPIQGGAGSADDLEDLVVEDLTPPTNTDLTEAQIEALFPIPSLINSATQMNVSTSGIGVNNNNLNGATAGIQSGDESFVVNPETLVDSVTVFIDNSVGGYNPATEALYYTVYYADGTVSAAPVQVTAGMLEPVTSGVATGGVSFDIDGGAKQIDAVQLTMGLGTIKIPVIAFTVEEVFEPEDLQLDFTATLLDGDGDSSSDDFSVNLVV